MAQTEAGSWRGALERAEERMTCGRRRRAGTNQDVAERAAIQSSEGSLQRASPRIHQERRKSGAGAWRSL